MAGRAHPSHVRSSSAVARAAVVVPPAPPAPTFEEVFQRHLGFVWRVLRSLGAPQADLDDLCQEVFVIVHRRLGEFEGRSSLSSWIYAICWRVWQDQRRRAYRRRERTTSSPPDGIAAYTPGDVVAHDEEVALLSGILDRLDPDKRAVFVLYEIEELGMKEIATALACPLQTAYTRLHAARDQVRREWRRLAQDRTDRTTGTEKLEEKAK
jgi:RNA polymerase sigma-70 factor, ECF subfamily